VIAGVFWLFGYYLGRYLRARGYVDGYTEACFEHVAACKHPEPQ
jgi:hypothetical protein